MSGKLCLPEFQAPGKMVRSSIMSNANASKYLRRIFFLKSSSESLIFSKLKEFADNNFKFDENGRKLFKRVENTVGKGEIARYEQFFLFPQCFQQNYTAATQKRACLGKGLILYQTNPSKCVFEEKFFGKHYGNQHSSIHNVFYPNIDQ